MQNNVTSQKDKNIDDLIEQSHEVKNRARVSSEEVEEKLKSKMREIDEKRKEEDTKKKADELGVNYVFLKGFPVSHDALILVSEEEARNLKALCFVKTDAEIRIAAVNPLDKGVAELLKRLEKDTRTHGEIYKISELSFEAALKLYASIPKPRKFIGGIEITEEDLKTFQQELQSFRELDEKIKQVSTTDMVNLIMAGGLKAEASDVHIEAGAEDIQIRFRIDGVLYNVATLPKKAYSKVVSRIKLVAKLKINVVDVPQDGRFTIYLTNEFIDVRVSTVPSAYGENIVMRLLMSSATGLELEDLGITGTAYKVVETEIDRSNGMILTTGPTGSGKTSTLYAFLKKLNKPETKIITLENPIEYRLKGVTQSQVESSEEAEEGQGDIRKILTTGKGGKKHFTFASGLRAVLRQDPDIVMVGEVRDHETAEIAIQAALTGHLMLSTLHTNSAAGAIPRLLSMEVKPFLLAPALNMIIGQRLVRKICIHCKEEYTPPPEQVKKVEKILDSIPLEKLEGVDKNNKKFHRGKGCDKCNDIGYKGRIGIFEILTMNEEIEKLILSGQVSEYQIRDIAQRRGMVTMLQDGIIKSLKGFTNIDEVFRETD